MRAAFASFTFVLGCIATTSTADVILSVSPSIITVGETTKVVISLTATDAFAILVNRIAFDFDGDPKNGQSTDPQLVVSDFQWLGKLNDPTDQCALSDLPDPHTSCATMLVPYGGRLEVASVTLTGTEVGVFSLVPNAAVSNASDGSAVKVIAGDPSPIKVVPEPNTATILMVFAGMIVVSRRRPHRWAARWVHRMLTRASDKT